MRYCDIYIGRSACCCLFVNFAFCCLLNLYVVCFIVFLVLGGYYRQVCHFDCFSRLHMGTASCLLFVCLFVCLFVFLFFFVFCFLFVCLSVISSVRRWVTVLGLMTAVTLKPPGSKYVDQLCDGGLHVGMGAPVTPFPGSLSLAG